jgi:hypothetical protein
LSAGRLSSIVAAVDPFDGDIEELRRENRELRAQLERMVADERRARERHRFVLKRGGSLLVPLVDRQRVVRNFVAMVQEFSAYTGPRDGWPKRDIALAAAEAFAVSLLRFFIRRRFFYLLLSVAALAIPVMQVALLLQQNKLVDLQNRLIAIQADDIVARGVTTDNLVTNQINGALLAGRNFEELSRMLRRIFGADMGDLPSLGSTEGKTLYLKNTAGRAHLLLALAEALKAPVSEQPLRPEDVWRILTDARDGALGPVLEDADDRLFVALPSPKAAFGSATVEEECQRYIIGLSYLLRWAFSLAVTVGERDQFFTFVAPFFERVSRVRVPVEAPLRPVFAQMFQNLLVDIALEPKYGAPEAQVPKNVDAVIAQGLARLQAGLGPRARVQWPQLKALLDVR